MCSGAARPNLNQCSLQTPHPAARSMSRRIVQAVATDGSGRAQSEEEQSLLS